MGRIIAIALIGVILTNVIRQTKAEYAVPLSLAVAITLLTLIVNDARQLYIYAKNLMSELPVANELSADVLKICIIGYTNKFTCSLCEDYGHKSIADKVDAASKIAVSIIALPWVYRLMVDINKLL